MHSNTPKQPEPRGFSRPLLLLCTAVNLYLLGAACLLQFVGYPLLLEAGDGALSVLHTALTRRLGVVFILPEFLALLTLLPLLYWRPVHRGVWRLWVCLGLGIGYFIVTFGWHLPAHKLLAAGDASAMPRLLVSHAVRTIMIAVKCALLIGMLGTERVRPS